MKRTSTNHIVVPRASGHRFYGHGIPGVISSELAGKLIVVEGADGSGTLDTNCRAWWNGWKPAATPPCRSA